MSRLGKAVDAESVRGKTPSPGGPVARAHSQWKLNPPRQDMCRQDDGTPGRRWWSRVLQVGASQSNDSAGGSCSAWLLSCWSGWTVPCRRLPHSAAGSLSRLAQPVLPGPPASQCPSVPNVPTPPLRARIRIPHLLSRHQTVPALCQNLF